MPETKPAAFGLRCLSNHPEEKQPWNGAIGIERLPCLAVDMRLDREGQIAVRSAPDRLVARVAVWQSALNQLAGHVCLVSRIGVLLNIYGGVQETDRYRRQAEFPILESLRQNP